MREKMKKQIKPSGKPKPEAQEFEGVSDIVKLAAMGPFCSSSPSRWEERKVLGQDRRKEPFGQHTLTGERK